MPSTSIGKWLAYVILAFLAVFVLIIFFKEQFLDKFMSWTLGILGIVAAGTVVYIIFKIRR